MKTYDELMSDQEACVEKARQAIKEGSPVGAREWYEAAEAAADAARATLTPTQPVFQGSTWQQHTQYPQGLDCGCPANHICMNTACPRAPKVMTC